MDTWQADHCPVCHEVVGKTEQIRLSPEAQKELEGQIWRPGDDIPDLGEFTRTTVRRDIEKLLAERKNGD